MLDAQRLLKLSWTTSCKFPFPGPQIAVASPTTVSELCPVSNRKNILEDIELTDNAKAKNIIR